MISHTQNKWSRAVFFTRVFVAQQTHKHSTHVLHRYNFIPTYTDYAYPFHISSFSLQFIFTQSTALFVDAALPLFYSMRLSLDEVNLYQLA